MAPKGQETIKGIYLNLGGLNWGMIKGFKPRLYQETILNTATKRNTMVVLPTGLGKTFIFLMLADYRLRCFPKSKVLMLAPTKPLAQQHLQVVEKHLELPNKKTALLTGSVPPKKRVELWQASNLIFSTPQTIENDAISGRLSLENVSLVCFDECHRGVGNYSYVWIAKEYMSKARFPRILGLTASPGSEIEKITEVCKNLFIEDIEVRTYEDSDVRPYVKEIDIRMVEVDLPQRFKLIKSYLESCFNRKINGVANLLGGSTRLNPRMPKRELLEVQRRLYAEAQQDPSRLRAISLLAEALKIQHALELLETQGSFALNAYLTKLVEEARTTRVKAVKNLVNDKDFKSSLYLNQQLVEAGIEHPKIERLVQLIDDETKANPNTKIIVFNQYRDSAKRLEETLNKLTNARAKLFVGQAKRGDTGLTQKKQRMILEDFRNGVFNVLISTSIGEEGLDIPRVDLVIFYEPIPSAIRSIQRRGRTGRQEHGRVIVLVTKDTRDVAYKWASYHKERRMYRLLREIKQRLGFETTPKKSQDATQSSLKGFIKSNSEQSDCIRVIADTRESGSNVLKMLSQLGAVIELKRVESADYICSKDVGIELKTSEDFVNSIIDRRLLIQAKLLRENFTKPMIVVQDGNPAKAMVNAASIYGAIASLVLGYQIPIITTKSPKETAYLIYAIAKSEQQPNKGELSLHYNKPLTLKELQEYIVSALPGIGPKLAKLLLQRFGSIKGIVNASTEELQEIALIGPKKANAIKRLLESSYPSTLSK